jgi:hypothetical protein
MVVPSAACWCRQTEEKFKHLGGTWSEQDQIAKCPPAVHLPASRVVENRPQSDFAAVDISNHSLPHGR